MTAVSLLSGGLDSTVATTIARQHGGVELALTVDYRHRAVAREIEASRAIADALSIRHRVIRLDFLSEISNSALLTRSERLPLLGRDDLDDVSGLAGHAMRRVWVPNRNGLMIALAASFAEALGADEVVVGFNAEEAGTFPDNSQDFLDRMTAALGLSTLTGVRVTSPTIAWDKTAIVRAGYEQGAPMEHVWSCYEGGTEHCWACESCQRLRRALDQADCRERFERATARSAGE